jgi:hypothetical protein
VTTRVSIMNTARQALGASGGYADDPITGATLIRAAHIIAVQQRAQ